MGRLVNLSSKIRRIKRSAVQFSETSYNQSLGEMKITINGTGYIVKNVTPNVYSEIRNKISQGLGGKVVQYMEQINRGPLQRVENQTTTGETDENGEPYISSEKMIQMLNDVLNAPRSTTNVIPGGVADNVDLNTLDKKQLQKGVEDEIKDHGVSFDQAVDIAADEIKLNPKEYLE